MPVQSVPIAGFLFNYVATVDGIRISAGQSLDSRSYLNVSTSILYTEDDNKALETNPNGGRRDD